MGSCDEVDVLSVLNRFLPVAWLRKALSPIFETHIMVLYMVHLALWSSSFDNQTWQQNVGTLIAVCVSMYYVSVSCYTWSCVCDCSCACLSRSSLTVAVSVWPVTLQPVQVSALTRTTVTGCSRTSWPSLSSLPLSSPLEGHQATWFSSG